MQRESESPVSEILIHRDCSGWAQPHQVSLKAGAWDPKHQKDSTRCCGGKREEAMWASRSWVQTLAHSPSRKSSHWSNNIKKQDSGNLEWPWKHFSACSPDKHSSWLTLGFQRCDTLSGRAGHREPEFWPTKLWANNWCGIRLLGFSNLLEENEYKILPPLQFCLGTVHTVCCLWDNQHPPFPHLLPPFPWQTLASS